MPVGSHRTVEGGGLRCWGLATGIHANTPEVPLTVAYSEAFQQAGGVGLFDGIHVTTWRIDTLPQLLQECDSVLVSYCMGDLSETVARLLRPDQQLILDCYVPIYVEVSARDSPNPLKEFQAFEGERRRWEYVLDRGDAFLCTGPAQYRFYQGVLSAVGRLNPVTYHEELLHEVPFGVPLEPATARRAPMTEEAGADVRKILWFGGLYPWFDIREVFRAVAIVRRRGVPVVLFVVGARNPFNTHPDFAAAADRAEMEGRRDEYEDAISFVDWVPYDERADWYADADVAVVATKGGPENELAWRTRMIDYIWAGLPVVTTGEDPVSALLLEEGAAVRCKEPTAEGLSEVLMQLLTDEHQLSGLAKRSRLLRERLSWDQVARPVARLVATGYRAPDVPLQPLVRRPVPPMEGRVRELIRQSRHVPQYRREHGTVATLAAVGAVARSRAKDLRRRQRPERKVVVLVHQLDLSGAAFVIVEAIRELVARVGADQVELQSYLPIDPAHLSALAQLGVRPRVLVERSTAPDLSRTEVLLMNTIGLPPIAQEAALSALEGGRYRRCVWFIHEDHPSQIFAPDGIRRLQRLLHDGRLQIVVPGQGCFRNYQRAFGEKGILMNGYPVRLPKRYSCVRHAEDFSSIRFMLSGTMHDGRKGQLPVFYAFRDFYQHRYLPDPDRYRDFHVTFVGLEGDFLSQQLRQHQHELGEHVTLVDKVPREGQLQEMLHHNVTISYSLREALPLVVFEAMVAGHVILRNDSSGVDEQLRPGGNGFLLDTQNFEQVVETIARVLDRQLSAESLARMSDASRELAAPWAHKSFNALLDALLAGVEEVRAR